MNSEEMVTRIVNDACGCRWGEMKDGGRLMLERCPTHATPQDARIRELEERCREVALNLRHLYHRDLENGVHEQLADRLEEGLK